MLVINDNEFKLTKGLFNLLTKNSPNSFSKRDLNEYKKILLLTNVHRQGFNPNGKIIATKGWKYRNVIAKMFPPTRKYVLKNDGTSTRAVNHQEPATRPLVYSGYPQQTRREVNRTGRRKYT